MIACLFAMYVEEFWVSRINTGMRGRMIRWQVCSLCPVLVPRLIVYKPIFIACVDIKVADCEVFVFVDEVMLSFSTTSIAALLMVFFSLFFATTGIIGCTPSSVPSVGVGEGAVPTLTVKSGFHNIKC